MAGWLQKQTGDKPLLRQAFHVYVANAPLSQKENCSLLIFKEIVITGMFARLNGVIKKSNNYLYMLQVFDRSVGICKPAKAGYICIHFFVLLVILIHS
jgi:hypothetical protein